MFHKIKRLLFVTMLAGLALVLIFPPLLSQADGPPVYLDQWGGVSLPAGVTVDSADNVYVADSGNSRIQKFDGNGNPLGNRSISGTFTALTGVAVDSAGNIYLTDANPLGNHVWKLDGITGTNTLSWGSSGSADGQFTSPTGIAVDSSNDVYVADQLNHRIQKFDSNGTFLTKWGSSGSADGQFNRPFDVAVDSAGNVYMTDSLNFRVQKFDSSGNFLRMWGFGVNTGDSTFEICTGSCRIGITGNGDGQFSTPAGIGVDSAGNVYVTDRTAHRIQKFDSNGNFLTKWGSFGTGNGEFNVPADVTIDSANNVYVADESNNRIQKFGQPSLLLTKTVDDDTPQPGQRITYTITVDNNSTETSTNAVISDTLPTELQFVGPVILEGTNGITDSPPILASGLTITAGARITLTFPVTVNPDQDDGTIITNIAAITSAEITSPITDLEAIVVLDTISPTFPITNPLITPTLGVILDNARPVFEWYAAWDNSQVLTYFLTLSSTLDSIGALASDTTISTTQTSFTPTVNLPNGVYTWTVRVYDAAGNTNDPGIPPQTFSIQANNANTYLPIILKNQ